MVGNDQNNPQLCGHVSRNRGPRLNRPGQEVENLHKSHPNLKVGKRADKMHGLQEASL